MPLKNVSVPVYNKKGKRLKDTELIVNSFADWFILTLRENGMERTFKVGWSDLAKARCATEVEVDSEI